MIAFMLLPRQQKLLELSQRLHQLVVSKDPQGTITALLGATSPKEFHLPPHPSKQQQLQGSSQNGDKQLLLWNSCANHACQFAVDLSFAAKSALIAPSQISKLAKFVNGMMKVDEENSSVSLSRVASPLQAGKLIYNFATVGILDEELIAALAAQLSELSIARLCKILTAISASPCEAASSLMQLIARCFNENHFSSLKDKLFVADVAAVCGGLACLCTLFPAGSSVVGLVARHLLFNVSVMNDEQVCDAAVKLSHWLTNTSEANDKVATIDSLRLKFCWELVARSKQRQIELLADHSSRIVSVLDLKLEQISSLYKLLLLSSENIRGRSGVEDKELQDLRGELECILSNVENSEATLASLIDKLGEAVDIARLSREVVRTEGAQQPKVIEEIVAAISARCVSALNASAEGRLLVEVDPNCFTLKRVHVVATHFVSLWVRHCPSFASLAFTTMKHYLNGQTEEGGESFLSLAAPICESVSLLDCGSSVKLAIAKFITIHCNDFDNGKQQQQQMLKLKDVVALVRSFARASIIPSPVWMQSLVLSRFVDVAESSVGPARSLAISLDQLYRKALSTTSCNESRLNDVEKVVFADGDGGNEEGIQKLRASLVLCWERRVLPLLQRTTVADCRLLLLIIQAVRKLSAPNKLLGGCMKILYSTALFMKTNLLSNDVTAETRQEFLAAVLEFEFAVHDSHLFVAAISKGFPLIEEAFQQTLVSLLAGAEPSLREKQNVVKKVMNLLHFGIAIVVHEEANCQKLFLSKAMPIMTSVQDP